MARFFGNLSWFGSFLVFILLEAVCFFLIYQFNQRQREILVHSSNLASGYMYEKYNQGRNYFRLESIADSIANENAQLVQRISNDLNPPLLILEDTLSIEIDTTAKELYKVISAKVINNSVNKNYNTLTLNKGATDGINDKMGLITKKGVIGIVRKVSDNYSLGISLINRQTNLSAAIKRNNYFGTLKWDGTNPTVMSLKDIPKHAEVLEGDTIITSGHSTIFPKGITIGEVINYKIEPGSNFYSIEIRLAEDLSNINYVYAIDHLGREEIIELESSIENE